MSLIRTGYAFAFGLFIVALCMIGQLSALWTLALFVATVTTLVIAWYRVEARK